MAIKRNLHWIDIIVRLVIGGTLVYIGFIDTSFVANSTVRILLGVFGAVNIVAGLVKSCPIYALAGISTYRQKTES